jgi:hypothetical protein
MRKSDYAAGVAVAAGNPLALYVMEKVSPSFVGRGGFAPGMRLTVGLGLGAGFLVSYSLSYRMCFLLLFLYSNHHKMPCWRGEET